MPPFGVSSHCFTESGVRATNLRSTTNSIRTWKTEFIQFRRLGRQNHRIAQQLHFDLVAKKSVPQSTERLPCTTFLGYPSYGSYTNTWEISCSEAAFRISVMEQDKCKSYPSMLRFCGTKTTKGHLKAVFIFNSLDAWLTDTCGERQYLSLWIFHRSPCLRKASEVSSLQAKKFQFPNKPSGSPYILCGFPNSCWLLELSPICASDNPTLTGVQTSEKEPWNTMFSTELLSSNKPINQVKSFPFRGDGALFTLHTHCTVILLWAQKKCTYAHTQSFLNKSVQF